MSRLNKGTRLRTVPMATEKTATGLTHEGAKGFERAPKTELFMRATTVFAGEGTFYEDGGTADARAVELVRKLAIEDWPWVAGFLPWLRSQGNIRTSSVMLACEAAEARAKVTSSHEKFAYEAVLTPRQVVDLVLQRGDEPTEAVQYCLKTFGRIPMSVRRGVGDAMTRLWSERSAIRYDKPDRPMRFADAIELIHPQPKAGWQSDMFGYLLTERHHPEGLEIPASLGRHHARKILSQMTPAKRHAFAATALDSSGAEEAQLIRDAACGQWEWVMSWLGERASTIKTALTERQRWELIIPDMGYMALIRNLRNFEQAGVRPETVKWLCDKIADPKEVANSRQLPFRFLSAHLNTNGAHWLSALETALMLSLPNVPVLSGRTLILIDTSGSMQDLLGTDKRRREDFYRKTKKHDETVYPSRVLAATLFALALAVKNAGRVDVFGFATGNFGPVGVLPGQSVLRATQEFTSFIGKAGHGTEIERNVRMLFDSRKHDRVAIFTDEQAFPGKGDIATWNPWGRSSDIGDVTNAVPASVPVYSWNLDGSTYGSIMYGDNRVGLTGLTDASFGIMSRYEAGRSADWPWLKDNGYIRQDDADE